MLGAIPVGIDDTVQQATGTDLRPLGTADVYRPFGVGGTVYDKDTGLPTTDDNVLPFNGNNNLTLNQKQAGDNQLTLDEKADAFGNLTPEDGEASDGVMPRPFERLRGPIGADRPRPLAGLRPDGEGPLEENRQRADRAETRVRCRRRDRQRAGEREPSSGRLSPKESCWSAGDIDEDRHARHGGDDVVVGTRRTGPRVHPRERLAGPTPRTAHMSSGAVPARFTTTWKPRICSLPIVAATCDGPAGTAFAVVDRPTAVVPMHLRPMCRGRSS